MQNLPTTPATTSSKAKAVWFTAVGAALFYVAFYALLWVYPAALYAPAMVLGDSIGLNPELSYQLNGFMPTSRTYDRMAMGILALIGGLIGFSFSRRLLYGVVAIMVALLFYVLMLNIANSLLLYDFQTDQFKHPRSYTD